EFYPCFHGEHLQINGGRVGDLHEVVRAVETERLTVFAGGSGRGAAHERAVVCANDVLGIAIAGPPTENPRRRGHTTSGHVDGEAGGDAVGRAGDIGDHNRVSAGVRGLGVVDREGCAGRAAELGTIGQIGGVEAPLIEQRSGPRSADGERCVASSKYTLTGWLAGDRGRNIDGQGSYKAGDRPGG